MTPSFSQKYYYYFLHYYFNRLKRKRNKVIFAHSIRQNIVLL